MKYISYSIWRFLWC